MNLFSDVVSQVVSGLRTIGYQGNLLEENYKFPDWFSSRSEEWSVAAAAFCQTPVSYDSACIGVACDNGLCGVELVNKCRALGAPVLLEVGTHGVTEWAVSRTENSHGLIETYSLDRINEMFATRAGDWRPQTILRAKNIGSYHWNQQLPLFVGLLPELEHHIQGKLDPLLRETLSEIRGIYLGFSGKEPNEKQLFQLIFWVLTAKVFFDRQVPGFAKLSGNADELLVAVAKHYKAEVPRLLTQDSRQVAATRIWRDFDFRNLSVEVLAQIWAKTLVDQATRKKESIYLSSRTIVHYILERIPFLPSGEDRRIILEPCSGSSAFLVGAMNILRHNLFGADAAERHRYFVKHLFGIEKDPFAVEISKLALTLADFPNPNGWNIIQGDVFEPSTLKSYLQRAGVVLCNPPYSDFDEGERHQYRNPSVQKPAALLNLVLDDLHPEGALGFVLPRRFIDGGGYAGVRQRLAHRFATLELTVLPDRAFDVDSEVVLLVATDPIPHKGCRVTNRKVNDDADSWSAFEQAHEVSSEHVAEFSLSESKKSFLVPELPDVWGFLVNYPHLQEFAELHRGIQWKEALTKEGTETGLRQQFIRDQPADGYALGVAPRTTFNAFERPRLHYLNVRPEDEYLRASQLSWEKPKAILNKAARSRGSWRLAAFPDTDGIICYQTFIGVWPTSALFDEWLLAAVLNSPVANAFVATREGKTDITLGTLRLIPMPHFTEGQRRKLRELIEKYQQITSTIMQNSSDAEMVLKEIDATVLSGYRMPPRIERELLDFFRGHERPTSHPFGDYVPPDCQVYFSLSEYLSPDFAAATSDALLKRLLAHG